LILSEFAGAAVELQGALLVNPNDINQMKDVLLQGLTMDEGSQQEAMDKMQAAIAQYDIARWTNQFISDLQEERELHHEGSVRIMTYEERMALFENYRLAAKRLILLDYDGTLSPFFNDPQEALPSTRTREILIDLAADPRNRVVIISGRDKRTLDEWFAKIPVELVAEHGGFHRTLSSTWSKSEADSSSWKPHVREVMEQFVKICPGTFIEEKEHSVVWHYRAAQQIQEDEVVSQLTRELAICNTTGKFSILQGNKIIEARNSLFDKGSFVDSCLSQTQFDFVLAVGDDNTDEAMFAKLTKNGQYSIKVGLTHTTAMYNLISVSNVFSFLEQLIVSSQVLVEAKSDLS
jgi:trehalose 6-phosphate synthase/phosphatase